MKWLRKQKVKIKKKNVGDVSFFSVEYCDYISNKILQRMDAEETFEIFHSFY